jgi:hypothetical protein
MSESLTKSIYKDSVNQQSNIFYKKYCKYKKKYLELKKIGGSNGNQRWRDRIDKELEDLEGNDEFVVISESPYEFHFRNLKIKLDNKYPFKIILENKITNKNINSSYIWSPIMELKNLVDNYDNIINVKKKLNKIPINSNIYENETLAGLNREQFEEQLLWVIFKTVDNLAAKSFAKTVKFFNDNKCKLIISFDNNDRNLELIRNFISYDQESRNDIVEYLFERTNIEYFICPDESNIFFYDPTILNKFLTIINEHQVFENTFTIDDLLKLSCVWEPENQRDPVEYNLIHILFGSTNKCVWQSQGNDKLTDMEDNGNDNEKMKKLKSAYNYFLNSLKSYK